MSALRLRASLLGLAFGIPLAASCAHDSSPSLESRAGAGEGGKPSSAGKASGGSATAAGSSSSQGGGNAFGGTNAAGSTGSSGTAGNGNDAQGGEPSTAGSSSGGASSGGSGGASSGGTAGSGGASTVPPDVLARASAVVYYETTHVTASDKTIQMKLHIVNQSTDPLPMDHVAIRYWLTAETTPTLHQYYVAASLKTPKAEFVNMGASSNVLMTFGGGSVVKGGDINASEVQLEISSNSSAFDQSNDFSWDASAMASKPNPKITLYLDGTLIWGCEPSGQCFDDAGAGGGAGGDAPVGQAGQTGAGGAP